jgi:hypothetical protein
LDERVRRKYKKKKEGAKFREVLSYRSEAQAEAVREAVRVDWVLRNCKKLATTHKGKFFKLNFLIL